MQQFKGYYPTINLAELKQLPVDSFGYQYAEFMQINNLQPLNISPALADIAQRNVFALRYAVSHDIFHVL